MEGALKVEPALGDPEFLSNFAEIVSFTFLCKATMHTNYKILRLRYTSKKRGDFTHLEALEYKNIIWQHYNLSSSLSQRMIDSSIFINV